MAETAFGDPGIFHSRTPPLIHGDIKPSNLMIGPGGRLVLLDFGACLSLGKEKRERYGTKVFAAPEQLDEKLEPDIRSDFYSAGKTFRFLSGGKESPGFRRFLDICMQEDRSRRFSDDRKLQRRLLRVCRKGKRNCLLFSFSRSIPVVFWKYHTHSPSEPDGGRTISNLNGEQPDRGAGVCDPPVSRSGSGLSETIAN